MDLDEDERQRRVMLPQMGVGFDTDVNHTQQPPSAAVHQPIMKPMCQPSPPTSAEGKRLKSGDAVKKKLVLIWFLKLGGTGSRNIPSWSERAETKTGDKIISFNSLFLFKFALIAKRKRAK